MKIFVSPSTQEHNAYAGGSNEEVQMRLVCAVIVVKLRAAGHTVMMGGTVSASANVAAGNKWGAQLYIAVHSNAGGGEGTEAFYYTGSTKGKALATSVYNRVRVVSVAPDRGVKATTKLVEVSGPNAPATIIELAFHDDASDSAEIKSHISQYGTAVAQGILDIAGGSVPVTPKPTPPKVVTTVEFKFLKAHTRATDRSVRDLAFESKLSALCAEYGKTLVTEPTAQSSYRTMPTILKP